MSAAASLRYDPSHREEYVADGQQPAWLQPAAYAPATVGGNAALRDRACHDAAYAQTKRGIARAIRDGGFIDCGDLIASPVWTEPFEDGERVLWGGLRMLRRVAA